MALGDTGVHAILVIGDVTRDRAHRARDLVEYGPDLGAVSAVLLGTAVKRGGTMMAASGWRSLTLAYTPS